MKRALRVSLLLLLVTGVSNHTYAQKANKDNSSCHDKLSENESRYNIGRFFECIDGLRDCIASNAYSKVEDKVQAYQLMALSYLAIDSMDEADNYIERILSLNDNYSPDGRSLRFRNEVDRIRLKIRASQIASVSKKNENIDLAPATIQIITEKDIRERGYKDVEEIFSDLPGFDVSRTRGVVYSVLYQRGYRTSANTDRTMILIDGVEDNDMWSNAAYLGKQFPISNIKRIEVIYGPASTIYGANAYAGVINIVTKGEEDLFSKNSNKVTATAQMGGGTFNTGYANATVATRSSKAFFSVTGGYYHSDEEDLSKYPGWDGEYNYADSDYKKAMTMASSVQNDSALAAMDPNNIYYTKSGKSIVPTAAAIAKAKSYDQTYYRQPFRNVDPGKFSNTKNDYYVSSKLNIGDLKLQFEYFNRDEGLTPDFTQKYYALNNTLQNWQVRQGFFAARYDKRLTNKFKFSSSSFYRVSDRGKNAVQTTYSSYLNGGFKAPIDSLITGAKPFFTPTYKSTQSTQFRTEARGIYTLTDKIDVTGGVELRHGLLQGDYVNSSLYDPLKNGYMHDSASYYAVVDLGIFALASYNNEKNRIKVDLGGRVDNNVINNDYGYGSVFNPRLAFIYYPKSYIFKAIYSEAFLDASPFNKLATTSQRLLNNPTLQPEKVKNIEASAKYLVNRNTHRRLKGSVELAYYHSWYSNSLVAATVNYNGSTTTQFQAVGKALIQGLQLSADASFYNFTLYANATYTDPFAVYTSITGTDSSVRMGDIAQYSTNIGVNYRFLRSFDVNVRANIVGDKKTGIGTTTNTNPYSSTPGYAILNGTFGYSIRKVGIVQFRVDNIFDQLYYSPGTREASGKINSRIPQPGRIFYGQFILNLNN